MVKAVIVMKIIIARIKWWININQFNLPSEFLFQTMQGKKVVSLDNQVIIRIKSNDFMLALAVIFFEIR